MVRTLAVNMCIFSWLNLAMGEMCFKKDDDTIYDLLDVGRFNQQNPNGKDESREETR